MTPNSHQLLKLTPFQVSKKLKQKNLETIGFTQMRFDSYFASISGQNIARHWFETDNQGPKWTVASEYRIYNPSKK